MPAANRHLPVVETRRLPQHKTYWLERLALKTVSRLVRTDGSLLFVVRIAQIQHERHNAGDRTQGSKDSQQCRSYMYRLPRDEFPVRANTRLHSALTGWQATVFYRAPSTKEEKTRLGRWASTTFIIQTNRQMSNKFAFCRNTHARLQSTETGDSYILLLIVEIRMSPATTRSSGAKPPAKLSE